jgi:hypothetical protein
MESTYRVKIGQIEIELAGEPAYIEKERSIFFDQLLPVVVEAMTKAQPIDAIVDGEGVAPQLPLGDDAQIKPVENSSNTNKSVNEFLIEKNFRSQEDLAVGLIYYESEYQGKSEISSEDLKSLFLAAKITVPPNPSDKLLKLSQKGYIQQIYDAPKKYSLTQTGISYVQSYEHQDTKSTKKTSKTRRSRSKTISDYNVLTREKLNLTQYPDIKDFKDFKQKMMLALYIITKESKGEYFSNNDVQHIMSEIFGESATKNQIKGVFATHIRWFNKNSTSKKDVKYKLLNDGFTFVEDMLSGKSSTQ